jgi:O-antigen ligase
MTESVHKGVSPSVKLENQIIDKKASKWESVLLHLVIFAILLPTAAQSIFAAVLGLSFLIPRSWRFIAWPDSIPQIYLRLVKFLLGVWGLLLVMSLLQAYRFADFGEMKPYFKLIGKQGVWGSITIASILFAQMKRKEHFLSLKSFLVFTSLLLVYALIQRYTGIDWVHGFASRLGDNRFAYGVYRVSGWMDHPLTFAFNLMLLTLFSLSHGLWLAREGLRSDARLWFAETALLFALLFLTDSRYPMALTFLLGALLFYWEFPKFRKFCLAGMMLCGLGLTLVLTILPHESLGRWGELIDSKLPLEQRFDRVIFWKINWQLFLEDPWLGTGLGQYPSRLLDTYLQAGYTSLERKYNAHNIYLQTFADGGVLGGLSLVLLLTGVGLTAWQVNAKFKHRALTLIFLATLLGGLLQNHLRDTEYLFALWTSIGLCLSCLIVQGKVNESRPGSQLQDLQP